MLVSENHIINFLKHFTNIAFDVSRVVKFTVIHGNLIGSLSNVFCAISLVGYTWVSLTTALNKTSLSKDIVMLITREVMTIASPAYDMFFFLQMVPLLSVASAKDVLMTPPQLETLSPWRNQSKKPYGCVVSSTTSASRTSFRHEFFQTIKGRSSY